MTSSERSERDNQLQDTIPSTVENQQHGCIKTTVVTETTPSFFAEHLGGIVQIFTHRDVDVGEKAVLGGRGNVLTLIKNISLASRLLSLQRQGSYL